MRLGWLFPIRFLRSCCNHSVAHHMFVQRYTDEVGTGWGLDFDKTVARRLLTELRAEHRLVADMAAECFHSSMAARMIQRFLGFDCR